MTFTTRLLASLQDEVSAADVEALLRGSGQLEDVRDTIEQARQAGERTHPGRPWEVHQEISLALVYFWVAESFAAIARALKEVDDEGDTPDHMPEVSHDQAVDLLRRANRYCTLARMALDHPDGRSGEPIPIELGPRVQREDDPSRPAHLKGLLRGADYLDGYAQVEVETYCNAVAEVEAPRKIAVGALQLHSELERAQATLRTAKQVLYPMLGGERVDQNTRDEAERLLWSALATYVWLGQAVAVPSLGKRPSARRADRTQRRGRGPTGETAQSRSSSRWYLLGGPIVLLLLVLIGTHVLGTAGSTGSADPAVTTSIPQAATQNAPQPTPTPAPCHPMARVAGTVGDCHTGARIAVLHTMVRNGQYLADVRVANTTSEPFDFRQPNLYFNSRYYFLQDGRRVSDLEGCLPQGGPGQPALPTERIPPHATIAGWIECDLDLKDATSGTLDLTWEPTNDPFSDDTLVVASRLITRASCHQPGRRGALCPK